jgi:Flp pilus assembly protein TadD
MKARQWKTAERRPSDLYRLKAWLLAHRALIAGLLVIALLLLYFSREILRPTIIIEVTAVPKVMKDAGLDADVLTKHLLSRIEDIENENYELGTTANPKSFRDVQELELPAYDIPGLHVSTRDLIKLLRHALGKEPTTVDISVSQTSEQTFRLRGRIRTPDGQSHIVMPDTIVAKYEEVTEIAAFSVLGQFDPVQLANMLYLKGDRHHVDVLQSCIDRLDREKKVLCLVAWGDIEIDGLHDARARARYQQALAWKPETVDALVGLGYIEQLRGNVDSARDWLERARKAGLASEMVHYYQAQSRLYAGEIGGAVWELQQVVQSGPPNAGLLMALAYAQRQNKKEAASTDTMIQAMDADLSRAATMSGWGRMLVESGQVDEGMQKIAAAKGLMGAPQSGVYVDISDALAMTQDMDGAIKAMRTALNVNPTSSYLRLALAARLAAAAAENLPEAEQHLRDAIENDAEDWRAYGGLGYVLALRGESLEAEASWRRAVKLNPTGYETYQYWGDALFYEHKYDEATQKYRQALGLAPSVSQLHESLASALSKQGGSHRAEAEEAMAKSVKLGARTPGQLIVWAGILERHEKFALAEEKLREAITMAPRLAAPSLALGEFLLARERNAEAVQHYRQALAAMPDNPDLRFGWINALLLVGDFAQAEAALEEAGHAGNEPARMRLVRARLLKHQAAL